MRINSEDMSPLLTQLSDLHIDELICCTPPDMGSARIIFRSQYLICIDFALLASAQICLKRD